MLFAVLIVVAGCQSVDDYIGTGPITLSPAVANHFKNEYLEGVGPQYYIITADGRDASYTYCVEGGGGCQFGVVVLEGLSNCEKRTNQKCFIFAEGDEVVWRGPIEYGGRQAPRSGQDTKAKQPDNISFATGKAALKSMTDKALCELAVKGQSWETDVSFEKYVKEARSRILTPSSCRVAMGYKPERPATVFAKPVKVDLADLNDKTLCRLGLSGEGWETHRSLKRYVDEAISRGLTPQKCQVL